MTETGGENLSALNTFKEFGADIDVVDEEEGLADRKQNVTGSELQSKPQLGKNSIPPGF